MISAERLAIMVRSWWAERGIELWSLRSGAKPGLRFSPPQHPKDQVRIEISVGYAFDRRVELETPELGPAQISVFGLASPGPGSMGLAGFSASGRGSCSPPPGTRRGTNRSRGTLSRRSGTSAPCSISFRRPHERRQEQRITLLPAMSQLQLPRSCSSSRRSPNRRLNAAATSQIPRWPDVYD